MMPVLVTLWQWRKAILYALVAALVAWLGYRAYAYGEVKEQLGQSKAELAAERNCEPATACATRIATLAAEAEQRAAEAASVAVRGAAGREEAARAAAAEWRAKYRAAQAADPDCAAWAAGEIKCPL